MRCGEPSDISVIPGISATCATHVLRLDLSHEGVLKTVSRATLSIDMRASPSNTNRREQRRRCFKVLHWRRKALFCWTHLGCFRIRQGMQLHDTVCISQQQGVVLVFGSTSPQAPEHTLNTKFKFVCVVQPTASLSVQVGHMSSEVNVPGHVCYGAWLTVGWLHIENMTAMTGGA